MRERETENKAGERDMCKQHAAPLSLKLDRGHTVLLGQRFDDNCSSSAKLEHGAANERQERRMKRTKRLLTTSAMTPLSAHSDP